MVLVDVPKFVVAVVLDIADVPFASLGAYEVLVERLFSYPFILTVKLSITAFEGISLKLKPLKYKYLEEVEALVFVIVAYVVLSVLAYILLASDTDRYDVDDTAYVLGINLIVGISYLLNSEDIYLHYCLRRPQE
jgi:hypothetical protein